MANKFTGRAAELNSDVVTGVRLLAYQRDRLLQYAEKYNMSVSGIIREAVTIWLNQESKGDADNVSLVSQD